MIANITNKKPPAVLLTTTYGIFCQKLNLNLITSLGLGSSASATGSCQAFQTRLGQTEPCDQCTALTGLQRHSLQEGNYQRLDRLG